MLLVLSAIWMKDSQTDRHKRAFWDLLQLQEAASLSKFATWHWWSACLPMWYVSLHMCTSGRSRKHNWECVQRLESCLTTSLVCLCPCALRLPSALLPLLASPPLSVWLSLLTGHIGKQVEERSQGTDITQALCSVSGADQCRVEICAAFRWQRRKQRLFPPQKWIFSGPWLYSKSPSGACTVSVSQACDVATSVSLFLLVCVEINVKILEKTKLNVDFLCCNPTLNAPQMETYLKLCFVACY